LGQLLLGQQKRGKLCSHMVDNMPDFKGMNVFLNIKTMNYLLGKFKFIFKILYCI